MKFIKICALALAAAPFAAHAQNAAPAAQALAIAAPVAGKGQVIFFRRARHTDNYWDSCPVREGTALVVKLKGNRYFALAVEPGVHHYFSKRETTDKITLEVEAGERYFVECGLTVGIVTGRPDLRPSSTEEFATYAPHLKPQTTP